MDIEELPTEIITYIVDFCDPKSQLMFCSCSKYLHEILPNGNFLVMQIKELMLDISYDGNPYYNPIHAISACIYKYGNKNLRYSEIFSWILLTNWEIYVFDFLTVFPLHEIFETSNKEFAKIFLDLYPNNAFFALTSITFARKVFTDKHFDCCKILIDHVDPEDLTTILILIEGYKNHTRVREYINSKIKV